jgi:hypothetical protein
MRIEAAPTARSRRSRGHGLASEDVANTRTKVGRIKPISMAKVEAGILYVSDLP